MKAFVISDTHDLHDELPLKPADMIIHAGDLSYTGTKKQFLKFLDWFDSLEYEFKIFIAGNHEFYIEKEKPEIIRSMLPEKVHYLCDSGVCLQGIHFWGSPITPKFHNWAFNRRRGKEISAHWNRIPIETEVLITHGPPFQILDRIYTGESVGCLDLFSKVVALAPRFHIFGHIHESFGQMTLGNTTYINASFVDKDYTPINSGVCINLDF